MLRWLRLPAPHISRVLVGTAAFLLVLATLTVLVGTAVFDMRQKANQIDDARAVHAAQAAIRSFQTRLAATARDNAIWDDAFYEIPAERGAEWAYENWGKNTVDYPLYDVAMVFTPSRDALSAYKMGSAFDPVPFFGKDLTALLDQAQQSHPRAATAFLSATDGVYLLAANMITPFTREAPKTNLYTLVYAKRLTPAVVEQIGETFDIEDLALSQTVDGAQLNTPLPGPDGSAISFFEWPSRKPGQQIFDAVRGYIASATAVILVFFVALGMAGFRIGRQLHRDTQSARWKATHDALTGLWNRAGLIEHLAAEKEATALALIDLDGFKDVNDAWGHAVGDELIRLVARRLTETSTTPRLIARLGGDEFAVTLEPTFIAACTSDLLERLSQPFVIGGRTIEVGASIGGAVRTDGATEPLELIRQADMALYQAKESGRGIFRMFTRDLDAEREDRSRLEEQLKEAIATGQITPYFQPLVDARSGSIRGVEALARWRAPSGPISPEIFIPVAERAGLIDQLGHTILGVSIDAAANWPGLGISVNVSPIQLRNPLFATNVENLLRDRSFDPTRLTLEITEGVLMSNPDQAKRAIGALKSIGVKFALDDFGCGYASIGALREFGFDRMKIDRSLVQALGDDKGAQVLAATISLANALDIPVTAEGVETREQAAALTISGCDLLQGYLIGRPMDQMQFEQCRLREAV